LSVHPECSKGEEAWGEKAGNNIIGSYSDSAKREKEDVTFAIRVHTMWYEEKVSNFEIVVAKLKETLRNIKFATLCRSVA
jgi:hypothetical protein